MKKEFVQLLVAFVPLFGGLANLTGQDASIKPLCSEHPAATRAIVVKARNAGHGIREQYSLDLKSQPPGREVTVSVETGGGDCPAESTLRGNAAAAVGALLYNGQIHCSAVLVSSNMIVTAAHCIRGFDENKFEFVLGFDSGRPVQRASVYRADVHELYDESRFGVNDIGYAYLNRQMTEATPVQLPDGLLSRSPNLSVLHVGYGISGAKAGARRCVNIPVLDRCDDSFSYATKNLNTCGGDSGGAAFRDLRDKVVLAGLTDWGDEACVDFGVDIDVGNYLDWIQARKGLAPRAIPYARLEGPRQGPQRPEIVLRKILLQLFDHGEIGLEHVQRLLREVAHIQAGAEPHASGIRSAGPGNHFEKRSLARAVSSHDGPAFSTADGEIESFINHTRPVTLMQILQDGHLFAGSRRETKLKLHQHAFLWQLNLFDLIQRLNPALHLGRFGRMRPETIDEALFFGKHGLLPGERCLLVGFSDRPLALIKVIVAGERDNLAAIDLCNL
jgi:hypothetical protein